MNVVITSLVNQLFGGNVLCVILMLCMYGTVITQSTILKVIINTRVVVVNDDLEE